MKMNDLTELLSCYVAFLRVIYLIHQNNHWISKGENFYGNHLLFQRLYESAQEDADLAAEKIIGLFGAEYLDFELQKTLIAKLSDLKKEENAVKSSLEIEKKFLAFSKKVYDILKKSDKMTLGLDDMLMSIASKREESVYLLTQSESE